jgi:Zn-dependent protease with chaperone function
VSHLAWLAAIFAGGAGVAAAVLRPAVTAPAPRLAAVVEVLTLAGIGLMPPLLLACAAAAAGTWSGAPGHMLAGACVLAAGPAGPAQLALYGLAAALLARAGAVAARAAAAVRRAGPRGRALAAATPRRAPGGVTAWVVPSGQAAAWCGGLRRPQVVVTTALLGLLSPAEQQAVLAHEAAHVRLGHPRILLAGAVIGRSYRWLPPARLAWDRLRRDNAAAAAAPAAAAAAAGTGPLLSALAKVALAATPPAATAPARAGFADPQDLRYRIRRLQAPAPRGARSATGLALAGAVLTGGLAAAACQLLHAGAAWPGLIGCLAAFGYLGWRPSWARTARTPAARSLSRTAPTGGADRGVPRGRTRAPDHGSGCEPTWPAGAGSGTRRSLRAPAVRP